MELAQRWFHQRKAALPPDWGVAYAKLMCDKHPSGVVKTSKPQPQDLVVFSWAPYGHVAVITKIDGSTVHVLEQNASPSGRNSYSVSQAECFLTVA